MPARAPRWATDGRHPGEHLDAGGPGLPGRHAGVHLARAPVGVGAGAGGQARRAAAARADAARGHAVRGGAGRALPRHAGRGRAVAPGARCACAATARPRAPALPGRSALGCALVPPGRGESRPRPDGALPGRRAIVGGRRDVWRARPPRAVPVRAPPARGAVPRVRGAAPGGRGSAGARDPRRPPARRRAQDDRGRGAGSGGQRVPPRLRRAALRPADGGCAAGPGAARRPDRRPHPRDGDPDPARGRRQPGRDPGQDRAHGPRAVRHPAPAPGLHGAGPFQRLRAGGSARGRGRAHLPALPGAHDDAVPRAGGADDARDGGGHTGRGLFLDPPHREHRDLTRAGNGGRLLYLVAALFAASVALLVVAIGGLVPARPRAIDRRLAELVESTGAEVLARRRREARRERLASLLQDIGDRIARKRDPSEVRLFLVRAGYRHPAAPSIYWGSRIALAAAPGIAIGGAVSLAGARPAAAVLAALWVAAAGWVVPAFVVGRRIRERQKELVHALPDALDLLVVCVEAGLGLNQALLRVSEEIGHVSRVMSEELALVNLEIR